MVTFVKSKFKYIPYVVLIILGIILITGIVLLYSDNLKQKQQVKLLQTQLVDQAQLTSNRQQESIKLQEIITKDRANIQEFLKNYELINSEIRLIFDNMNKCVGNVTEALIEECKTAQELIKIHNDNYTNLKEKNIKIIEDINKTDL